MRTRADDEIPYTWISPPPSNTLIFDASSLDWQTHCHKHLNPDMIGQVWVSTDFWCPESGGSESGGLNIPGDKNISKEQANMIRNTFMPWVRARTVCKDRRREVTQSQGT